MTGWVSLHRKILEWEWYDDANVCRLFIHCLLKANHQHKKWKGIDIERGQFITSLDKLSKETGLSVSQVRTCLKKLKSTGEIASKSHTQHTVITVLSYDLHQCNDKPNIKQVANKSQANDKQIATTNNDNKENNENKEKCRFSEFWDLYGKKTGKDVCERKFKKLKDSDIEKIFSVLPSYIASTPDVQYRKNPSTWLNQKCWEDELELPQSIKTPQQQQYDHEAARQREIEEIRKGLM